MNILGMDIGGKTRNGLCLMNSDSERIIKSSFIVYDSKGTPLDHRMRILKEVRSYINDYGVDYIVFERINLFRGQGVSPLANIISLCKLQTTLIDNLSDLVPIADVVVRSWKSRILGSAKATKEDALKYVSQKYPEIDLKVPKFVVKNPDPFEWNHDLADSVCISLYGCRNIRDLEKNKVNFK